MTGVFFACALLATLVVWYQARNLEEKVLKAIQPHLSTDVRVGSVEMTLWSGWPNAELVFKDVAIEDAISRGRPFAEFAEVGIEFGWLPLLEGKLEMERVQLNGGRLDLFHGPNGEDNWSFWKEGEGGGSLALSVGELGMMDVVFSGKWWTEGEVDPVEWESHIEELDLEAAWEEGILSALDGDLATTKTGMIAGGKSWVDEVGLVVDVGVQLSADDAGKWNLVLSNGSCVMPEGRVPFEAMMGATPEFGMALRFARADAALLQGLVPGFLSAQIGVDYSTGGEMDVDILTGRPLSRSFWSGPDEVDWNGEWATRVELHSVRFVLDGWQAESMEGEVTAYGMTGGFRSSWTGVSGKMLEGEFRSSGQWVSQEKDISLDLSGEVAFRPAPLYAKLADLAPLPSGWSMVDQGSVRGKGSLSLERKGQRDWTWKKRELNYAVSGLGVEMDAEALVLDQWEGTVSGAVLEATVTGFEAPGVSGGGAALVNFTDRMADVSVECGSVDMEKAMSWLPFDNAGASSRPSVGDWQGLTWKCEVGLLALGGMDARNLSASGEMDLVRGRGMAKALEAQIFDGRASGTVAWDQDAVTYDGMLAGAVLSELLAETEGLGQSTLKPEHTRGRIWADGLLRYRFGRAPELLWETDLDVRIEGGELVDFALLQRIPETLREEGRFRMLSDADDLSRRLKWVRFEPIEFHVALDQGVISLDPTDIASDAMDVGIAGWQRLSGGMDYTLDFALRDLKSNRDEFGSTADDGLGHRFFLAITGTMDEPEFGYDKQAHRSHRQEGRRAALDRLKGVIGIPGNTSPDSLKTQDPDSVGLQPEASPMQTPRVKGVGLDDDDDF